MKLFLHLEEVGEATVSQLVKFSGLKQPTVSYHLKEMEEGGILVSRKAGKEVFYKVSHACPHDSGRCALTHKYVENN